MPRVFVYPLKGKTDERSIRIKENALEAHLKNLEGGTGPAGPSGPAGPAGPEGPEGDPGTQILVGSGPPGDGIGSDGDFYLDNDADILYGPKETGAGPTEPLRPTIGNALSAGYDASQFTGISEGTPVASWPDISGNGNTLTDWAGANYPLYRLASQNGLAGLEFIAACGLRKSSASIPSPRTFFMVVKNPAAPSGAAASYFTEGGNTLMSRWTTSGRWVFGRSASGGQFIEFTDTVLQGQPTLWTFKYQAAGAELRANQASRITGTIASPAVDTFVLMGSHSNNLAPTMTMYEYLIYDGIPSAGDIDLIEDYLYAKWFVPWGPPDPWPIAVDMGGGADGYVHVQATPSSLWTINHPLGFYPNVAVVDSAGDQVEGSVDYVDADTITISFSAAFSGTAYLS